MYKKWKENQKEPILGSLKKPLKNCVSARGREKEQGCQVNADEWFKRGKQLKHKVLRYMAGSRGGGNK